MSYTNEVLADSPWLYWRVNEADGTATVADSSGNARTGTVVNSGGNRGFGQSGLLINDPGDRAFRPYSTNPSSIAYLSGSNTRAIYDNNEFSIELWVKRLGTPGNFRMFGQFGASLQYNATGTTVDFVLGQNNAFSTVTLPSNFTLQLNQTHHIVATASYSGGVATAKIYVDGVEQNSNTYSMNPFGANTANSSIGLGANVGSTGALSSLGSDFILDEPAIYLSSLSLARVAAHYNTGISAPAVAPTNSAVPTISGTAKVGQTLTSTNGTWSGAPTPTYAYQWQSASTSGGSYSNISGATSSSYTIQSGDAGKYLRLQVTATNVAGSASAESSASAQVVQDVANTALPSISYTDDVLQVGSELTSNPGTWEGNPSPTYAYQWQVSDDGDAPWSNLAGSTSSSLTVPSQAGGKYLRLEVIATNSENSATSYSTATGYVSEDPVSVVAPSISGGQAKPGQTITCDPGEWTGFPSPNFSFQWQVSEDGSTNWQTISGATTSSFLIRQQDAEKYLRCTVQGSNNAGEAVAASAPFGPIVKPGNATAAIIGALSVSGAI
jgi:hypothetical protein